MIMTSSWCGLLRGFHDAVYAIPAGQVSNEEASAAGATGAEQVGLEQEDQPDRTAGPTHRNPCAGATRSRRRVARHADLAILASDPTDYADYVAAIREEYAQLPEEEFLAGRLAVLTELADREIFRTAKDVS